MPQQGATSTINSKQQDHRKRRNIDQATMVYGKVPPQARDLEEAVLGAIMIEKYAIDSVTDILKPECFYVDANQRIYQVMLSLQQRGQPIDIYTVIDLLKAKDELELVGGPFYVTKLTKAVVSSANIVTHALLILEKYMKRECIRIGGQMVQEGYEDSTDVFDLIEQSEREVYGITQKNLQKDFVALSASMVELAKDIEGKRGLDTRLTGVPTGYNELDLLTHGWQGSNLVILAARPSVGKTAFALNLARNAATIPAPSTGKVTPTAIFSLEMSRKQLNERLLSAQSQIYLDRIKTGSLDDGQMKTLYDKGINHLAQVPIFIDDTAGLTCYELRAKCRRLKNKHNIGLVIIDYLQLMSGGTGKNQNREQEISTISRELKKLAKDLQVPIIALSQLSRKVEERGKGQKVPQLSDLRESGAIEQDADMVAFIYRPPEDEVKEDANLRYRGMIKVAKNRDGALNEVVLSWHPEIQSWMELDAADRYLQGMGKNWKPVPAPPPPNNKDDDLPF